MTPVNILLVEDNEGDIMLTREALEDAKIHVKLTVVNDGKEAIDFLNKDGMYTNEILPDLLLLDMNLPKKNGLEVLQYIKASESLKHIPVIMLTTSSSPKDTNLCYSYHADCYITKPVEVKDFISVVTTIESFWISIVKLPSQKIITHDKR